MYHTIAKGGKTMANRVCNLCRTHEGKPCLECNDNDKGCRHCNQTGIEYCPDCMIKAETPKDPIDHRPGSEW